MEADVIVNLLSAPLLDELIKNLCCFSSNEAVRPASFNFPTKSLIVVSSPTSRNTVLSPAATFICVPGSKFAPAKSLSFVLDVAASVFSFPSASLTGFPSASFTTAPLSFPLVTFCADATCFTTTEYEPVAAAVVAFAVTFELLDEVAALVI